MSTGIVSILAPGPVIFGWKPCIDWCDENCQKKWQYYGEGVFVFECEHEKLAFLLRWG